MSNLSVFDFNDNVVRVILIDGNPYFVAKDVCKALEIVNVSDACERLDEDEKLLSSLPISGQKRDVLMVSESGLYNLTFGSRKESAKFFKKWITSEVIPSIRRTGSYSLEKQPEIPELPSKIHSVVDYMALADKLGFANNPYLVNYAEILTVKEMGLLASGNTIQVEKETKRITTCTVRAIELGYEIAKDYGAKLGKYVKSRVRPVEKKVQEGRYLVYAYLLNNELDNAIHSYYKGLNNVIELTALN